MQQKKNVSPPYLQYKISRKAPIMEWTLCISLACIICPDVSAVNLKVQHSLKYFAEKINKLLTDVFLSFVSLFVSVFLVNYYFFICV